MCSFSAKYIFKSNFHLKTLPNILVGALNFAKQIDVCKKLKKSLKNVMLIEHN